MKNFVASTFIFLFAFLGSAELTAQCIFTNTSTQYEYNCSLDPITFTNNMVNCLPPGYYCKWYIEKKIGSNYQVISTHNQANANDFVHVFQTGGSYRVFFEVYDGSNNLHLQPCHGTPTDPDPCKAKVEIYDNSNAAVFTDIDFDCSTNTVSVLPNAGYQYSLISIAWGDGNVSSSTPNGLPFTHTYSSPLQTSYNITVTVLVSYGCAQGTYTFTDTYTTVPQLFWSTTQPDCEGMRVCHYSEVVGLDYFQWFDSNGNPISGQLNSGCVNITSSGNYTVQITGTNGCTASETFTFNLPGPLNPGGLYTADNFVSPGQSIQMSSVGNPDGNYIVYEMLISACSGPAQWAPIGWGPLPATSNFTVPSSVINSLQPCMLNGDFELCFRAKVFCEDPEFDFYNTPHAFTNQICLPLCAYEEPGGGGGGDNPNLVVPESDNINSEQADFSLFPNPTNDKFNLSLANDHLEGDILVQVLDINGQTLLDFEFSSKDNFLKEEIDLANYPAGIYVVKVSGNQLNFSKLLVKQ